MEVAVTARLEPSRSLRDAIEYAAPHAAPQDLATAYAVAVRAVAGEWSLATAFSVVAEELTRARAGEPAGDYLARRAKDEASRMYW